MDPNEVAAARKAIEDAYRAELRRSDAVLASDYQTARDAHNQRAQDAGADYVAALAALRLEAETPPVEAKPPKKAKKVKTTEE